MVIPTFLNNMACKWNDNPKTLLNCTSLYKQNMFCIWPNYKLKHLHDRHLFQVVTQNLEFPMYLD